MSATTIDLRDVAYEAWLESQKVNPYFQPALPLDSIDVDASLANQARLEPLDSDVVDRYAAHLEDPDATMPPILVRSIKRKAGEQLVILGGNHRYHGHRAVGRTTIAAYIVRCDDRTATALMYGDNRRHGLPPRDDERVAQALHLVDQGYNVVDAARVVGIHRLKVDRARYAHQVAQRAARLGHAAQLQRIPRGVHARLVSIEDDRLFGTVIDALADHRIPGNLAPKLIGDVNAAGTIDDALAVLDAHLDAHGQEPKGRGVGRPSLNQRVQLITAAGTIGGLDVGKVVAGCTTQQQRDDLATRCMETARRLKAIHDAVKAR